MLTNQNVRPPHMCATHRNRLSIILSVRRRHILVALVAAVLALSASSFGDAIQFTPDPAVGTALADLASAADSAEREAAWQRIQALDRSDRGELIRGLVYFTRDAQSTRAGMIAGTVIAELEIAPRTVIEALVPMLESTDDSLIAQVARVLSQYEDVSAARPPDYSVYREIIEQADRENAPIPRGLVAHMMRSHPTTALITMTRALRLGERDHAALKRLLWADHVIQDVIWKQQHGFLNANRVEPAAEAQLDVLLEEEAWWVRLYAARTLDSHPAFRNPARINQLVSDRDRQVREAAAAMAATEPDLP